MVVKKEQGQWYTVGGAMNNDSLLLSVVRRCATEQMEDRSRVVGWTRDDIIQETYCVLVKELQSMHPDKQVNYSFLYTIAKRRLVDRIRLVTKSRCSLGSMYMAIWNSCRCSENSDAFSCEDKIHDCENNLTVKECMDYIFNELELNERDRIIVERTWVDGDTLRTVGEKLGMSEAAVAQRVSLVRKRLKRRFTKEEFQKRFFGD